MRNSPAEAEEEGEEWSCDGNGCDVVFAPKSPVFVRELKSAPVGQQETELMLCTKCFGDLPHETATGGSAAPADEPPAASEGDRTALSSAAVDADSSAASRTTSCPVAQFMQVYCPWGFDRGNPAEHFNTHLSVNPQVVKITDLAPFVISPNVSFCDFCSRFYDNVPGAQHYRSHADACQPLRDHLSSVSMAVDDNDSAQRGLSCEVVVTPAPFSQNASGSLFCLEESWFLPRDFGQYTAVAGVQDFNMCFWLSVTADLEADFVAQQPTEQHQLAASATKDEVAPHAEALGRQQGRSFTYSQKGQHAERDVFLAYAEKRGPLLVVDFDAKHAELFRNPAHSGTPVCRVIRRKNHFCALAPVSPLALPGATGSVWT